METNKQQRSVKIITEIHPQHMGSMNEIERMIIQSKLYGANIVKLQLYNSKKLWGNRDRIYLDINEKELEHINNYCGKLNMELSASIFDEEQLKICEMLNFQTYKIASRTVAEDLSLCEKIIDTNKNIIISLGMYDYKKKNLPFKNEKIKYLYCVSKYPTPLYELEMPNFDDSFFDGYSDHSIGIDACLYAVSRGAQIVEKHFSNNKSLNVETQLGHTGSMDGKDLELLRKYSDSFTLLKNKN